MKLTNKFNLPQPLVDAVANDPYDKGNADYSITGLLKPPRIAELERQHADELTEDVSDRIASLIGQVGHGILERAERTALAEQRFFLNLAGKRISGKMDRYVLIDEDLQDYKFTTVGKIKYGVPPEFEQQLNCYRYLLAKNGYTVNKGTIVAILLDWRKSMAKRIEDYPVAKAVTMRARLWPLPVIEEFLVSRIQLHEKAKQQLPPCDMDDRWGEPDEYAVMNPLKPKRAAAVYLDEQKAKEHVAAFRESNYTIQKRPGIFGKRCEDHCLVAAFCSQYQNHVK